MNRLPDAFSATPDTRLGIARLKLALVAGPPSPLKPGVPLPATAVMIPVVASTRQIRLASVSAMDKLPEVSSPTTVGQYNLASVAGPPPPHRSPSIPPPATVVMIRVAISTRRIR